MRGGFRAAATICLCWLLLAPLAGATEVPCFQAASWVQADKLFRNDDAWTGADGASSVDLGDGDTLWLFGDTWIDPTRQRSRRAATMIRNSVALQHGPDPVTATIDFHWRRDAAGRPTAYFEGDGDEWFWPGHGLRLGEKVLVFLNRLRRSEEGLGFASAGWSAVLIENPDEHPGDWRVRLLDTPPNRFGIMPGFAGLIERNGHVYALGSADPDKTHPVYVLRWQTDAASRGELAEGEWWTGPETGWRSDTNARPVPVFANGQSELGIVRDADSKLFVVAQTTGFGAADIALRTSAAISGPWTTAQKIFRPPETERPDVMIYSAKLHPQLDGADLVLTYSTNSAEFEQHFLDASIYYPRFVRLSYCEVGAASR